MFQHDPTAPVVRRRMGFFSVSVVCVSAILMTTIVCATGLAFFGLSVVDGKADTLKGLVTETLHELPAICESLPPALADAVDDTRCPEYLDNLGIQVHAVASNERYGYNKAVVQIENKGDKIVSLLTMRIVGVDEKGDPISETNAWAATPIQTCDRDWRGPLLPHETRKFIVRYYGDIKDVNYEHEVTELRVWQRDSSIENQDDTTESTAVARQGIGY